jgi:hypothetical protein
MLTLFQNHFHPKKLRISRFRKKYSRSDVKCASVNTTHSLSVQPPWALASAFQFHDHFTDGRAPWTSDQLVAWPLHKHRTRQTQNKHIHTPNIHALCGIRTHDPSFRASEDSSCLRQLDYCDRLVCI